MRTPPPPPVPGRAEAVPAVRPDDPPRVARLLPRDARIAPPAPLADRRSAVALASMPGVGPARWSSALAVASWDATAALRRHAPTDEAHRRALADADRLLARAAARGIALHLPGDASYPAPLHDLPDAPPLLWSLGDPTLARHAPRVAVVGTRNASDYGLRATRALSDALAAAGACIVSGMAAGIDGEAHLRALAAGASTIAVLGSGVDVSFPAAHRPLHRRIVAAGLVLAEQPPGAPPSAGAFPRRNRIVAALADLVIVVEAGHRSGAMITAGLAVDLGRPVAAVPGQMDAARAAGTNGLLRDGAHVLATPDDALTLLALLGPAAPAPAPALRGRAGAATRKAPAAPPTPPTLASDDERALWAALEEPAPDLDLLALRAGLTPPRAAGALTALELRGLAECDLTGTVRRLG